MSRIKNYMVYSLSVLSLLFTVACSNDGNDDNTPDARPDGYVRVDFRTSGTYGAPLSDIRSSNVSAVSDIPNDPNSELGDKYQPVPIADGTSMWVAVYRVKEDETLEFVTVKSYRVSGRSMIPCRVDDDGTPSDKYDTPLYLPTGTYVFRAMGPARKLVAKEGSKDLSLYLDNGEWLIANDSRYKETTGNNTKVFLDKDNADWLVTLDPLINQTARLKFTLYSSEDDPFVHSLKMMPIGVEVSGLQNNYSKNNASGAPWNWTLCSEADTLIAYPGNKNTFMYLKEPLVSTDNRFIIETHILPTDAVSTPLVVLFNMEVNGNPTQFEMMLNRKMFRAGYSYHYRGRVSIENGVTAMAWESVSWDADIPFFPQQK